jgi:alginate O-acetyltransferase complex protein AlgI
LALAVLKPYIAREMGLSVDGLYFKRPGEIESTALLFFGGHLYTFWLYLEFSGYCDLAAAISWLIGYRPIENFRWCWFSTSLVDLWRRWHISLSFILRDYIFNPLVRKRWPPTLCLCVTFGVCGLWHVLTPPLLLWGVAMGLAVSVNQRWSRWMRELDRGPRRRLSRVRAAWMRLRPAPTILSWLVTMNGFCLLNLLFFGGTGGARRVVLELLRRAAAVFG